MNSETLISNSSSSSSCLMKMLSEIVANDQKNQDGFVGIAPIAFWTQLFAKYFLHVDNPQHDDLLFYVKFTDDADAQHEVEVYRRESTKAPGLGDPAYDWTETLYLNLIMQQLEYTLTCAICTKLSTTKQEIVIHKKASQQVYASPSRHNMEKKGKSAELCYPNIFFTVDNFDEVWNDLYLNEDEVVCVEVNASDKSKMFSSVIFLGSVGHNALSTVYDRRTNSTTKWATVMTLGYLRNSNTLEFVRMKGPNGKGYAEMAVQKIDDVTKTSSSSSLDQCSCAEENNDSSTNIHQSCPLHPLPSSKSDPALSTLDKRKQDSSQLEKAHSSNPFHRSSKKKLSPTALKTHLTYVTLPWHKIILDILRTFEKPTTAKRSILNRKVSRK